jgi:hypothetical protein
MPNKTNKIFNLDIALLLKYLVFLL